MKPWEIERTKRKISKLSSEKGIKIFFDLYHAAVKIIKASLLSENPHLSAKQIKAEINKLAESVGRS